MRNKHYVFRIIITTLFAICMCGFAQAAVIDFESLALSEGSPVTNIPGVPELSITGGVLVVPGSPRTAFNANSSGSGPGGIDDANSGNTLTSSTVGGTVSITFSTNIQDLQFYAVDVEVGSVTEEFYARVYDADDNLLHSITLIGGDPGTGDGLLTLINFSTGFTGTDSIRRLEFEGFGVLTAGTTGYAVDNFSYSLVPVPAAVWLFGSGLISLIGLARHKQSISGVTR